MQRDSHFICPLWFKKNKKVWKWCYMFCPQNPQEVLDGFQPPGETSDCIYMVFGIMWLCLQEAEPWFLKNHKATKCGSLLEKFEKNLGINGKRLHWGTLIVFKFFICFLNFISSRKSHKCFWETFLRPVYKKMFHPKIPKSFLCIFKKMWVYTTTESDRHLHGNIETTENTVVCEPWR